MLCALQQADLRKKKRLGRDGLAAAQIVFRGASNAEQVLELVREVAPETCEVLTRESELLLPNLRSVGVAYARQSSALGDYGAIGRVIDRGRDPPENDEANPRGQEFICTVKAHFPFRPVTVFTGSQRAVTSNSLAMLVPMPIGPSNLRAGATCWRR